MKFTETKLKGAFIIDIEQRGPLWLFCSYFLRKRICSPRFKANQCTVQPSSTKKGLYGMIIKLPRHLRLVRCSHGAIYDVVIDMRPEPTYLSHIWRWPLKTVERCMYRRCLPTAIRPQQMRLRLYIKQFYIPYERLRYDDPAFGIEWLHHKWNFWKDIAGLYFKQLLISDYCSTYKLWQ